MNGWSASSFAAAFRSAASITDQPLNGPSARPSFGPWLEIVRVAPTGAPGSTSAELSAPWGMGLERFGAAVFHVLLSGSGWLRTEEGRTIRLSAGDVAVLMRGERHELISEPGVPITAFADLMEHCVPGRFPSIGIAGGGDPAKMVCGFFKFERQNSHPLLRALPDMIHINAGSGP